MIIMVGLSNHELLCDPRRLGWCHQLDGYLNDSWGIWIKDLNYGLTITNFGLFPWSTVHTHNNDIAYFVASTKLIHADNKVSHPIRLHYGVMLRSFCDSVCVKWMSSKQNRPWWLGLQGRGPQSSTVQPRESALLHSLVTRPLPAFQHCTRNAWNMEKLGEAGDEVIFARKLA